MKKVEALQQRKELLRLVEQWTRAEIMARLGRFDNLEYLDYAQIQLDMKDKIRELIFGSSSLVELAERWGLLKSKRRKMEKRK